MKEVKELELYRTTMTIFMHDAKTSVYIHDARRLQQLGIRRCLSLLRGPPCPAARYQLWVGSFMKAPDEDTCGSLKHQNLDGRMFFEWTKVGTQETMELRKIRDSTWWIFFESPSGAFPESTGGS